MDTSTSYSLNIIFNTQLLLELREMYSESEDDDQTCSMVDATFEGPLLVFPEPDVGDLTLTSGSEDTELRESSEAECSQGHRNFRKGR